MDREKYLRDALLRSKERQMHPDSLTDKALLNLSVPDQAEKESGYWQGLRHSQNLTDGENEGRMEVQRLRDSEINNLRFNNSKNQLLPSHENEMEKAVIQYIQENPDRVSGSTVDDPKQFSNKSRNEYDLNRRIRAKGIPGPQAMPEEDAIEMLRKLLGNK